jgi:muramoyltetrapeptide carboxypeptidase
MSAYEPLQDGSELRVIAPSQSKRAKQTRNYERAEERLKSLGYKVSFGKYVDSVLHFGTAKAELRASDFNAAYADKNVKAVIAINGGWSANEILPFIDWEVVRDNPKPLIGFSDITVLLNAIYAKTGIIGLLGPNFGTTGYMQSWQYTLDNLNKVLRQELPIKLARSQQWGVKKSDGIKTKPWKVISEGVAEGILLGGNLGTFYLLQGTEYQPRFNTPFILALEDDDEAGKYTAREVSRRFGSMLQLPGYRENLQGIIIGRFQPDSKVTEPELLSLLESKQLGNIPVISNVDFGHTLPMVTLPIGGMVRIDTTDGKRNITLL